jgi:hypothetical protein
MDDLPAKILLLSTLLKTLMDNSWGDVSSLELAVSLKESITT